MMPAGLNLAEGEELIVEDELIYRQITKHMIDPEGRIVTHAFADSTGMTSYSRSSRVSGQESRDWHTSISKSPSLAVRGLLVTEVISAKRWVVDDHATPLEAGEVRAPGHCYVDSKKLDKLTLKSLRADLWMAATARPEIVTRGQLADGELDFGSHGFE